ncbi:MAG TPA: hypothetical protein VMZ31_12195 [Phycisphaerae bacterium]|nr:hypothetical protein [Phycisphaerae bacterium]
MPDTRLAVQYAKVYFSGSDFMSRPAIELNVRNESPSPISRAHFHAVVRSPGRTIPWLEDDFSYEIPGGLEPGEAAQWRLSPNMFSAWGKLPAERTDLQLDVTVVRIDGPTGQQLFTWQAAEQQAP